MHRHLSRHHLMQAALLAGAGLGACGSSTRLPAGAAPLDALKAYVEWAKRSGYVAAALQRHRIEGAIVAPAA